MGLLKARWSSLRGLRVLIQKEQDIERVNKWIVAVLILHNMVMKFKDNWEENIVEDENEIEDEVDEEIFGETGTELREKLKEHILQG